MQRFELGVITQRRPPRTAEYLSAMAVKKSIRGRTALRPCISKSGAVFAGHGGGRARAETRAVSVGIGVSIKVRLYPGMRCAQRKRTCMDM